MYFFWGSPLYAVKKLILLLAAIVASITFATAGIYSGTYKDNLSWELNTATGTLTISGEGSMKSAGTKAGYPWYTYRDSINHVVINEGITTVGRLAFDDYRKVRSVSLPSTLDSIMSYAFRGSNLVSVVLPSNLHFLGDAVFNSCTYLESINIPLSLTVIPSSTFDYCVKLNHIVLHEGIVDIGDRAFYNCSSLNDLTLGHHIRHIGWAAFMSTPFYGFSDYEDFVVYRGQYCIGSANEVWNTVSIREGTTLIAESVFEQQDHLTGLVLPNSLKYINENAFFYCHNLRSISFGDSLLEIDQSAFNHADSLTQLQFPNSLQKISSGAFNYCNNLQSVSFGNSLREIEHDAFQYCNLLTEIVIPDSVIKIGSKAFNCDSIKRVTIGKSLVEMGESAFQWENIQSLTWKAKRCKNIGGLDPNSFTSLPYYNQIQHGQLDTLVWGDEVEYIPAGICYGAVKLDSVIIPQTVTVIGSSAFEGCSLFTKVVIPDNVTYIEKDAFKSCPLLETITIGKSVADLHYSAFDTRVIKTIRWNAIHCNDLEYRPSAFYNLESITFGNEVEYVPAKLIYNAQKLKSLVIPSGVTEIGALAFSYCDSISEIYFPESLTQINSEAFYSQKEVTKTITCANPVPPVLGNEVFRNGSRPLNNALLSIPCQSFTAYKQSAWNNYFKNYEASSYYQLLVTSVDETMGTTTVGNINCDNGTVQIEATPKTGYAFVSWSDGNATTTRSLHLTQDTSLVATFQIQMFPITFQDEDGTIHCSEEWAYGTLPSCDEPVKEEDDIYRYVFEGWMPKVVPVTGAATYTAVYQTIRIDGTSLDQTEVSVPARKVMMDDYIYIFRGDKKYTITGQEVK